jgi:hypothetical protein
MVDPPPEISLLSLSCGWPLGANGSLFLRMVAPPGT